MPTDVVVETFACVPVATFVSAFACALSAAKSASAFA